MRHLDAEHLAERLDIFGHEAQPHLHHRAIAVARDRAAGSGGCLRLEGGHIPFPEQFVVIGTVEDRLRVAPMPRAGIPKRDWPTGAPSQIRLMTDNTAKRAVARQPAIPEELFTQLDLFVRHRVVDRDWWRPERGERRHTLARDCRKPDRRRQDQHGAGESHVHALHGHLLNSCRLREAGIRAVRVW